MYTQLEEAKEEVWKRWNNADLRRQVAEYVSQLPDGYGSNPCSVLSRYIATPNFEAHRFQEIAKQSGLKLICDVFPQDKFCTKNPEKYNLGKMKLYNGKGKNNGNKISNAKLLVFHKVDGKSFSNLTTPWGDSFVNFHKRMFDKYFPEVKVIDNSVWTKKFGNTLSEYYCHFLALFICHGILFENFLNDGDEEILTQKIVQPAFRTVSEHFGLKPLIVRLLPKESEADPYWCWYPGHLEDEVQRLMTAGLNSD